MLAKSGSVSQSSRASRLLTCHKAPAVRIPPAHFSLQSSQPKVPSSSSKSKSVCSAFPLPLHFECLRLLVSEGCKINGTGASSCFTEIQAALLSSSVLLVQHSTLPSSNNAHLGCATGMLSDAAVKKSNSTPFSCSGVL